MRIAITQLHWSEDANTLSTEVSDLNMPAGQGLPSAITVVGKVRSITFRNPVARRDNEGDLLLWTYTNTTNSVRLVIFND